MRRTYCGQLGNGAETLADADWEGFGRAGVTSLQTRATGAHLIVRDSLALMIQGVARLPTATGPVDLEQTAHEILGRYLEADPLPLSHLVGSFHLVLLDAEAGRVLLYRHAAATAPLYYHADATGIRFGSNLVDLLNAHPHLRRFDEIEQVLFLHRGDFNQKETLFAGVRRVVPGELILWERGQLSETVLATPPAPPAVPDVDATVAAILMDLAVVYPRAAVLLSGGVGSCALQAHHSRLFPEVFPTTFSLAVDHPTQWNETELMMRASRQLGTDHHLLAGDSLLATDLRTAIAQTGELPAADLIGWPRLALALAQRGYGLGLCGLLPEPARPAKRSWWRHWLLPQQPQADPAEQRAFTLRRAEQQIGLFQAAGHDLACPFLDSRLLPWADQLRATLGQGLLAGRWLSEPLPRRSRNTVPLATWLTSGGPLHPLLAQVVPPTELTTEEFARLRQKPGPVLYRLLGLHLWRQSFGESPPGTPGAYPSRTTRSQTRAA